MDAGGVVGDVDEEMQDATVDRLARDAQAAPAFSAGADSLHWRVGDQCHCTYVADGQEVYPPDNSNRPFGSHIHLTELLLSSFDPKIPSTRRRLTALRETAPGVQCSFLLMAIDSTARRLLS